MNSGKKPTLKDIGNQLLISLNDNGPTATDGLVKKFGMTRSKTYRCLNMLREKSFIEIKQGDGDKRMRQHVLTVKGREHVYWLLCAQLLVSG